MRAQHGAAPGSLVSSSRLGGLTRVAARLALAGKSPYDPTYVEECRIRAEAFFKEKEERKKAEELIKTQLAAEEAAASKAWTDTPEAERDVAVLFPGQGTQKVGMAGKLLESPAVQGLFELSSKVLGYDMVGLCAQGPQEKLDTTLYSQVGARPSPLTPSTFA